MIFLTGGARSGKSKLAVEMARGHGGPVRYVATAEASDDEMERRIAAHRLDRPEDWTVIEAPRDLLHAVVDAGEGEFLVVDCITLWISNLMVDHDDGAILERVEAVVGALADRGSVLVVSNEVGSGLVPMDPVGRKFRDLQGAANQRFAAVSERAYLVLAGKVLELGTLGAG
ncbi:MAG TPA: bifunctional adenosylcobinamide kinase/adenosylcobinamide-phosphate guanylyltransferase [Acidimicrobiia bacterium]